MLNRDDDASLERVINVPTRGIGTRTVEIVRLRAREQGIQLWQALHDAINDGTFERPRGQCSANLRQLD